MKIYKKLISLTAIVLLVSGCANFRGTSDVPEFVFPEQTSKQTSGEAENSFVGVTESGGASMETSTVQSSQTTSDVRTGESSSDILAASEPERSSAAWFGSSSAETSSDVSEDIASSEQDIPEQTSAPQSSSEQTYEQTDPETDSNPETETVSEQTEPENSYPEQTGSENGGESETEPVQMPENILLTSDDPKNFTQIVFDGLALNISGKYENDTVAGVYLKYNAASVLSSDLGKESFSISLRIKKARREYDTLMIYLNSGLTLDYDIMLTDGSAGRLPDDVERRNTDVVSSPYEIPAQLCAQYVSADLDETSVRDTLSEVQRISDEICAGIDDDYEKVRAIARWVSENIYYDFDASHSEVSVETVCLARVLSEHRTVCVGFSNIFSALCRAQGIECRNIVGTAIPNGNFAKNPAGAEMHEWNLVILDGREIWVDTGWNTANAFSRGYYNKGRVTIKYFDISDSALAIDHRADKCEIRDYFSAPTFFENTQPQ